VGLFRSAGGLVLLGGGKLAHINIKPHPAGVVSAMLAQRAIRSARNADG